MRRKRGAHPWSAWQWRPCPSQHTTGTSWLAPWIAFRSYTPQPMVQCPLWTGSAESTDCQGSWLSEICVEICVYTRVQSQHNASVVIPKFPLLWGITTSLAQNPAPVTCIDIFVNVDPLSLDLYLCENWPLTIPMLCLPQALATANSPSSCASFCIAIGATKIGQGSLCPAFTLSLYKCDDFFSCMALNRNEKDKQPGSMLLQNTERMLLLGEATAQIASCHC